MHEPYLNPLRAFEYGTALAGTILLVLLAVMVPRLIYLFFSSPPSNTVQRDAKPPMWSRFWAWVVRAWSKRSRKARATNG